MRLRPYNKRFPREVQDLILRCCDNVGIPVHCDRLMEILEEHAPRLVHERFAGPWWTPPPSFGRSGGWRTVHSPTDRGGNLEPLQSVRGW